MKGSILGTEDVAGGSLRCDVCVIGSGAGGAVLAAGLVERGLDVLVVEAGKFYTRADFDLQEASAYPRFYQEEGRRATADLAISILQGRTVGGSTTVNWTTCFRTPERVLAHWAQVHGFEGLDSATLEPHFEAVEQRLHIAPWPESVANANNRKLLDGCRSLGWEASPLSRNVRGCANSGYCGMGCPVDGKQAMHLTYLHDGLEGGLRLLADTEVTRLEASGDRIGSALATHSAAGGEPVEFRIEADVFALCGGAINSPALLLRSGLDDTGRVGRRTFLHPVVPVVGQYAERVEGFYGASQSIGSHQFVDRGAGKVGFFLEAAPVHPMIASTISTAFGESQIRFMRRLAHASALLGLCVDGFHPEDRGGRVSVRNDGRLRIDYAVTPRLEEAMRAAHISLARIHLAAGAEEVLTSHTHGVRLRTEADLALLESASYGAHAHAIFTAHQMGGCTMGSDSRDSVVRMDHRMHARSNLYVVDGSVLPTSLGVNPSETIYALAHRAVEFVASAVG